MPYFISFSQQSLPYVLLVTHLNKASKIREIKEVDQGHVTHLFKLSSWKYRQIRYFSRSCVSSNLLENFFDIGFKKLRILCYIILLHKMLVFRLFMIESAC